MITADSMINVDDEKVKMFLEGLSTDTKPIEQYKGMTIYNGSAFFELDTKTVYFYDEDGKNWLG